jgi:hypothetical protein
VIPTGDQRMLTLLQPPATPDGLRRETLHLLLTCYGLMAILFLVVYLWPR